MKEIVDDDRIEIRRRGKGFSASGVASIENPGYQIIAKVSRQIFGPLVVVPGMTFASTNSKHYATIADDAYRINLLLLGPQDLAGFHGTDERISVENLGLGTAAYIRLMTLGTRE